jgi:hypothetical protein
MKTTEGKPLRSGPVHEACGALHLHTLFSDGGIGFGELVDTAVAAELDYIIVTDHMTLKGKELGLEKFYGGLLVVVGYEHNDSNNRNHYLALGVERVFGELSSADRYVTAVRDAGGIGFIAHPFEKRNFLEQYPPYPWTDWDVEEFDGVELWNQMSEWLETLKSRFDIVHLLRPRSFLKHIPRGNLQRWDRLNRDRFVSAVAGVDAHTMKIRIGFFTVTVFPAKVELKGLRTHVYLDSPLEVSEETRSRAMLLDALRKGRGFISNYRCADARGTRIFLHDSSGRLVPPGVPDHPRALPAALTVSLPEKGDIRLYRDGEQAASAKGAAAEFMIERHGSYRLEIFRRSRAWIYSNPFPVGVPAALRA